MREIVKNISDFAKEYFTNFGLSKEEISYLVDKAINDLDRLIDETEEILKEDNIDFERLDKNLHAIKGLILQLGSEKLANEINSFRDAIDKDETLYRLKKLLNL